MKHCPIKYACKSANPPINPTATAARKIVSVPVIGEACCVPYAQSFPCIHKCVFPVYRVFFFLILSRRFRVKFERMTFIIYHQSFKWFSFRLAMHARKLGSGLFEFISAINGVNFIPFFGSQMVPLTMQYMVPLDLT